MKSKREESSIPKPKRTRYLKKKPKMSQSLTLDYLITNQGLQHISQLIFKYLDIKTLLNCKEVSKNWRSILENPWFWFKMCIQNKMPKVHQMEWKYLIKNFQASGTENTLTKYLIKTFTGVKPETHYDFHGLFQSPINLACKYGEVDILEAFSLDTLKDAIKAANTEIQDIMTERYLQKCPTFEFSEPYLDEEEFQCYLPYNIACENGHLDIVEILSDKNIHSDPNDKNPFHLTPLDYAVSGNQHHIVDHMIQNDFLRGYESTDFSGNSIYHRAAKYSDVEMLDTLMNLALFRMEYKFEIIAKASYLNDFTTVVSVACDAGRLENVKFVVEWIEMVVNSSDPNDEKVDIHEPTDYGMTPLHRAASNGHFEVVKYLITKGANPIAQDDFGYTPIHYALLMKEPIEYKSFDLTIPLHLTKGHIETVKYLVSVCKNSNIPSVDGKTPVFMSLLSDNGKEILPYLIQKQLQDKKNFWKL